MKRAVFQALVLMVLLTACRDAEQAYILTPAPTNETQVTQSPPEPSESVLPKPVCAAEELLNSMTLEEKIGQLFIIRPEALKPEPAPQQVHNPNGYAVTTLDAQMVDKLEKYSVGGIALFGKNIVTPEQLMSLISMMQQHSKTPLFIGTDEEGGSVSRVANAQNFNLPQHGDMQDIGSTGDSNEAKNVGVTIGAYLKHYGINLDFAPVADVNTNSNNLVIGSRSFGSDPNMVADMVSAVILGLHESGMMSCVKHYPGHGDTTGDTHEGFVSISKTWEELRGCELIPFINAITMSTAMVMISHITAPNITSDELPASLSYEMVQNTLREELGFTGVIITDAMEMGAISNEYSSADSAVRAVLAGIDIILMPRNFTDAYNGILTAVLEGRISEERINESVLRILKLKEQYALLHQP